MGQPLKLVPPRWWGLCVACLCLSPCIVSPLPNIQSRHDLQGTVLQNLDKSFFQPPALEETIHEVQQILNRDPTLPRLTRGEIEELYEKVTREEYHKSLEAGDKARADNMRALMLVLPYNTNNNTEENLQELFTRPPVTKVVDSYSSHLPIQFLTPSMHNEGKSEPMAIGQMDATTYKPSFIMKTQPLAPSPTTYHPSNPPPVLYRMTPSLAAGNFIPFRPLVTDLPANHDYGLERSQTQKPAQRFSSHYSAKDTEFLKQALGKSKQASTTTSTIKPIADILESLGIVNGQTRNRIGIDDFYAAESAPTPSVISVADLKGLRSQHLGPQINADAYSMFKPLNIGEEIRVKPEVEDYLTRFGIVGGRKRKAIKKNEASSTQNSLEQLSQESEIATAKVPANHVKAKKSASSVGDSSELNKLLENLRELERLNLTPKAKVTTAKPATTSTTSTTSTTTSTTTTPAPTTPALITNGLPLLIEPKKPRRRIDPNIDINFGNQGNHQTVANRGDQLSKLLENLQELEKLRINPENVLRNVVPEVKAQQAVASRPIAAVTPAPRVETQTLANRFSQTGLTPQQHLQQLQQQFGQGQAQGQVQISNQPDLQQLQQVLQQLQVYETTKKPTTTTTTTSTTKKPLINTADQLGPTDLWQLRKILTDDRELEKLFEQAKARQTPKTTTSTTTQRPGPSLTDLVQLQKYLAELDQAAARTTTTPKPTTTSTSTSTTTTTTTTTTPKPTTTTTSTTSTTTSTTPRPPPTAVPTYPTVDYESHHKKQSVDDGQLQELISRVQQLERLNIPKPEHQYPSPTDAPLSPFMGFTTRNVKASSTPPQDTRLPMNDFANLRNLYSQLATPERLPYNDIEISTKATAAKAYQDQQLLETSTRRSQNFAQRIIDITNDTGSGSSLQQVDANDFVQLQKLLSKVQELERVRINLPTPNPRNQSPKETTAIPMLTSAASQRTHNVHKLNGAQVVYPSKEVVYEESKESTYKQVQDLLLQDKEVEDLKLDLPTYRQTIEKPYVAAAKSREQTSSEELREIVYAQPYEEPNNAYKDLQPPMIHKTIGKEPPRFVATKPLQEVKNVVQQKTDLEELQKLLNNAQELKKLGIALPKELTQKLETKLDKNETNTVESFQQQEMTSHKTESASFKEYNQRFGVKGIEVEGPVFRPTTESPDSEEPTERTAVFSLTTIKSLTPRPPRTTTESSVEIPVFSATKIIEAAIKRAANKIGVVSTEFPEGFLRRNDENVQELVFPEDEMIADFSEFNYQMVLPLDEKKDQDQDQVEEKDQEVSAATDLTTNVDELQRLIKNLEELQKLNITNEPNLLRKADKQYLDSLKQTQKPEDDTIKNRRQSEETTETTKSVSESTTTNPTRVQLNLDLNEATESAASAVDSTTTASATTTSTPAPSTTTEESRNGSLADLEDSFGPDPNTESPPPPKKKNGFYFLADWNSFLEVGDGDDQVVVRLSPKIGDPRLFLPVKIP